METKRMITAICIAMMAVLGWQLLMQYIAEKNHWTLNQQSNQATTQPVEAPAAVPGPAPGGVAATETAVAATQSASAFHVTTAQPTTRPAVVSIGSGVRNDPTYAMEISIDPRGASVASVALNQFKQSDEGNSSYTYEQPLDVNGVQTAALATDQVVLDGKAVNLANVDWELIQHTPASAMFAVTIADSAGKPAARIVKTYQVFAQNDRRQGYEAHVVQQIENLSGKALTVGTTMQATVPPIREMESTDDRQILAGYLMDNSVDAGHTTLSDYVKTPTKDLTFDDKGHAMLWVGSSSVYFLALVRPEQGAKGTTWMLISHATAQALNSNAPSDEERQVGLTLATADLTLKPGASADLPMSVFFGPKKRSVIASDYYSAPPLGYDSTFRTMSHGFCGFCAFQPVIIVLVDMLRGFHFILRDWGLAIIALVVVVRLVLHPITRSSTISMQKMSKMGPEMEKLKTKFKDSPDELNKAMMQFYKEQGATPILGCLPMFLQTPIWIALWEALQSTFELRQAPFLHPFGIPLTWIHDLSKPDSIYTFAHPIPLLFGWHLHSINLLPILMGVVMYLQQKFTPRAMTVTPEQAQQQKMMIIMSTALFPLMLYTGPSGLNLYIFTSSAVGIWEYKIIRDHIKAREEAEKEGKVIVTGPKKWRRGGASVGEITSKNAERTGGLGGWLAKMQAMAEEVRKEQEKKKKQK